MKRKVKRLFTVAVLLLMLFAMTLPCLAYTRCYEGEFEEGVVVTECSTLNAPLIYGTNLSNGEIAAQNEPMQIGIAFRQDNFTPSLNIVKYNTGENPHNMGAYDYDYDTNKYHRYMGIYMEFMGDLCSDAALSIDALMSAIKMPEENGAGWWLTEQYGDFYVDIELYERGNHEERVDEDSFGGDLTEYNTWRINTVVDDYIWEDDDRFKNYSEFPNTFELPANGSVWIGESIDLVKIALTADVDARYELCSDTDSACQDFEYEIVMVFLLSNDYIPTPVTPPAETDEGDAPDTVFPDEGNTSDIGTPDEWSEGNTEYDVEPETSGDGSYASDFDELSPKEVAVGSAVAAAVAVGVAAGAAGAATGSTSGGNPMESGDNTFILTDPATGAESLYIYDDATGEWVSDDGRCVLDPSKIQQWITDRIADRKFADDNMKNLQNRNTAFDRQLREYQEQCAKQKREQEREEYVNKVGYRHGVYSGDESEIKNRLAAHQKTAVKRSEDWKTVLKRYDAVITATEVTGKAADLGIDAIATVNPALKPGQYLYYGGRNLASNLADAAVNKKDTASALRKAAGETVVDITQASVNKLGYKFLANTAGDAYKKALSAIDEGKLSADELGDAALSGAGDGLKKTAVAGAFKYAEGKLKPTGNVTLKTDATIKNLTKETSKKSAKLLEAYQGGTISRATYDGAKSVLKAKYVTDCRLVTKMAETYQNAAKAASGRVYDVAANIAENMTNDVVTGNNPFKRN